MIKIKDYQVKTQDHECHTHLATETLQGVTK